MAPGIRKPGKSGWECGSDCVGWCATTRGDPLTEPFTELDPRFSDPDATVTDWVTTRAALENAQLSWITTVQSDGRPHVTPLVSVWLDDAVYFCTGPGEQKAVNLSQNAAVAVTTGNDTWDGGIDVVVEGVAARVTGRSKLERLAVAWRTKWDGRWEFEPVEEGFHNEVGGLALVYEVRPTKVLAFAKGRYSQTRHVFR